MSGLWVDATTFTWLVPLSVLGASLMGSVHCASMCGPLALNFASDRPRLIAYQLGRMSSYTALGALGGALGEAALGATRQPWLAELSLLTIAVTLIALGWRTMRGRGFHLRFPSVVENALGKAWRALALARWPKGISSLLAGSLSILLPCGHLYGFAAGAVATGTWWSGAIFMFAFWLGTVPALGVGARLLRRFLEPGAKKAPRLAGGLLVFAGLVAILTFALRVPSHASALSDDRSEPSRPSFRCH